MKIKVICNQCKRVDYIDRKAVLGGDEPKALGNDNFGIPIPSSNGLQSYSIVHNDHTLIVEIDAEGNVRRQQIIERIDQKQEKLLTTISQELLYWNTTRKEELHLVLLFTNQAFQKLLLGIFHQLILNGSHKYPALLEVKNGKAILDFAYVKIYVGKWHERIVSFGGENSIIIFELSQNTIDTLYNRINTILNQNSFMKHAILFDESIIRTKKGKELMKKIYSKWPHFQAFDMSTSEKAIISLYTIIKQLSTQTV